MQKVLCTISTQSHLFKVKALFESLSQYDDIQLCCLITDSTQKPKPLFNEEYHTLSDLSGETFNKLKAKYTGNKLRWSLKPVYLNFLLKKDYERVIYCDNDIFFFDNPEFLFDKLKNRSVLLTPHFYEANPKQNQNWLEANFKVGLYNAGFIGVNQSASEMLQWWADCCLYNIKKAYSRGMFDDQKYLDLVPVIFDNVEVLKHRGCNLAGWNAHLYKITQSTDKKIMNANYPLVFIHFTPLSFKNFSKKSSGLQDEYLTYVDVLKKHHKDYDVQNETKRTLNDFRFFIEYLKWRFFRFIEK